MTFEGGAHRVPPFYMRWLPASRVGERSTHSSSACQFRLQSNFGLEDLRDWTSRLGLLGKLEEIIAGKPRHLGTQMKRDCGDAPTAAFLHDRQIRLGLQALGRVSGPGEAKGQRHSEASGMGRRDQLFRIGTLATPEPRGERVGGLLQGPAL